MNEKIVWLDVETSGVSPEVDKLLEIAMVISDMHGDHCTEPFSSLFKIKNLSEIVESCDKSVKSMHEKSGLWKDLWNHKCSLTEDIDLDASLWIQNNLKDCDRLYMGGNSLTLDRQFVRLNLPKTYDLISYRSIDVTSLSLVSQSNSGIPGFEKAKDHRALPDVYDSIKEYKHYLFWLGFSLENTVQK